MSHQSDKQSDVSKAAEDAFHNFMHQMETVCFLIICPLEAILPYKNYPITAVVIMFIVIYFMIEFIIIVMNVFSVYTGLSHFVVGLTFMVWGSDNMEMLNLAIAIAKGEEEMATIAVISCQILCIAFIIPLSCLSRLASREQNEI